jgi:hypothetical protein
VKSFVLLSEKASSEDDPIGADSIGQETEVTDADEAFGQEVEQEASDELDGG